MRYIVGTKIPGGYRAISPSGPRSKSIGQPQLTRHSCGDGDLRAGVDYSLYHIYKKEKGFAYVFIAGDEDRVEIVFDTTQAADTYIASLRGDKLSD